MKKLLTILTLLLMALTTAWAGEQTITISRNDGQYNSAQGVYYVSKGGVTMTMSGGMNNKNYLVLRNNNTLSFKSANFPIKKSSSTALTTLNQTTWTCSSGVQLL